jgi:hypothetical protein
MTAPRQAAYFWFQHSLVYGNSDPANTCPEHYSEEELFKYLTLRRPRANGMSLPLPPVSKQPIKGSIRRAQRSVS